MRKWKQGGLWRGRRKKKKKKVPKTEKEKHQRGRGNASNKYFQAFILDSNHRLQRPPRLQGHPPPPPLVGLRPFDQGPPATVLPLPRPPPSPPWRILPATPAATRPRPRPRPPPPPSRATAPPRPPRRAAPSRDGSVTSGDRSWRPCSASWSRSLARGRPRGRPPPALLARDPLARSPAPRRRPGGGGVARKTPGGFGHRAAWRERCCYYLEDVKDRVLFLFFHPF